MAHVTTAREETARQMERCKTLHVQLAQRRGELRRECERQRWANRRVAARVELLARSHHRV